MNQSDGLKITSLESPADKVKSLEREYGRGTSSLETFDRVVERREPEPDTRDYVPHRKDSSADELRPRRLPRYAPDHALDRYEPEPEVIYHEVRTRPQYHDDRDESRQRSHSPTRLQVQQDQISELASQVQALTRRLNAPWREGEGEDRVVSRPRSRGRRIDSLWRRSRLLKWECAEMSWEQYADTSSNVGSDTACVIDILIEPRRDYWHDDCRPAAHVDAAPSEEHEHGVQVKSVEAIRINSRPLCDILSRIMGKDMSPKCGSNVLKPYKALMLYKKKILEHRQWLQNDVLRKRGAGITSVARYGTRPSLPNGAKSRSPPIMNITADQSERSRSRSSDAQTDDGASIDSADAALEKAELCVAHIDVLIGLFDNQLKDHFRVHSQHRQRKVTHVTFENLWHLLAPGDTVYLPEEDRAAQLIHVCNGRRLFPGENFFGGCSDKQDADGAVADGTNMHKLNSFDISFIVLGFNGASYHADNRLERIAPFSGQYAITNLPLYPIKYGRPADMKRQCKPHFLPETESGDCLQERLLSRGNRYRELAEARRPVHCRYNEHTIADPPVHIDEFIMVDFDYFWYNRRREPVTIRKLSKQDHDEFQQSCQCLGQRCEDPPILYHKDHQVETFRSDNLVSKSFTWILEDNPDKVPSAREHIMILPPALEVYVLSKDINYILDPQHIEIVGRDEQAFSDVALDTNNRDLLRSLITDHSMMASTAQRAVTKNVLPIASAPDDGLVLLFHGSPGVGKTSTAEAVAKHTRRPLLTITCGRLGTGPAEIERKLKHFFTIARRWGCVLLLDEADVFLATRDRRDLERNSIVSSFLRYLEFPGIVILTTNRIGVLDDAFKSRIHLALYFAPLNLDRAEEVWRIHLRALKRTRPDIEHDESEITSWAAKHWQYCNNDPGLEIWNGREIRNACYTAATSAAQEGRLHQSPARMTTEHLHTVAHNRYEFDRYLKSLHGANTSLKAKRNQERRDDFVPQRAFSEAPW